MFSCTLLRRTESLTSSVALLQRELEAAAGDRRRPLHSADLLRGRRATRLRVHPAAAGGARLPGGCPDDGGGPRQRDEPGRRATAPGTRQVDGLPSAEGAVPPQPPAAQEAGEEEVPGRRPAEEARQQGTGQVC